ncbi:MAG: glycoside hydrolase family 88 protein, partial [Chitinispirillaceae bacterium]|nr:glycoside hydrolase family 88 protein [Chitinispirillaceae bacterium]
WGANRGILDKAEYLPTILRAWNAIADSAIFPDGAIGYVQGTGDSPGDNGSGVTGVTPSRDIIPDFDDYGLGCVLLAGSETAILAGDPTGAVAARSFERTFSKPVVAVQTISGLQRRGLSLSTATWYDLSGRSAGRSTIAHFFPMNVSTASGFFFMYPEDR